MTTPPPGTMYPSGTISPYQNGGGLALINLTSVVAACLPTTLVDEDGHAIAVTVVAEGADDLVTAPMVVCTLSEGEAGQQAGDNMLLIDPTTGLILCGQEYQNSDIVLTIRGRNDAERRYLMDALRFGLVAGFLVTPPNPPLQAAALVGLRQVGFSAVRFRSTQYARPVPDDARPQAMVWPAVLPLRCSIWMTWTIPTVSAPAGTVQTIPTIGQISYPQAPLGVPVALYGTALYGRDRYS